MGFEIVKKANVIPVSPALAALDGLVEEGYHVARLVTCGESVSQQYFNNDGTPKVSFVWDVEVYNDNGTNARVRLWTGQSLHEKSYTNHLARAIYKLGDTIEVGFKFDTDDCLGRPFRILLDVEQIEVDGVSTPVNRPNKPYVFKAFNGTSPLDTFDAKVWATVDVPADDDEIPF